MNNLSLLPENAFRQPKIFEDIGRKWIDYTKTTYSKYDINTDRVKYYTKDIESSIWGAIQETRNVLDNWISTEDSLPTAETPVYIIRNGKLRIGELRWDHPTYEDNYTSYRYWDDPNDDGQCWEFDEITHWKYLSETDKDIISIADKKYKELNNRS